MSVTEHQVDEIVAIEDPVLRNLRITVAYGRMAADFARWLPGPDLSWCGFGTWASEGVGGAIRHHHTDTSLALRVLRRVRKKQYPIIAATAAAAFADGNQSVFDHIGRGFARFHEALSAPGPDAVPQFLATLPGAEDPPPGTTVDLDISPRVGLADGFVLYERARTEGDPRRRAQLIAAANLCLAFVEQVRLQEPIDRAFGAVIPEHQRRKRWVRRLAARLVTETTLKLRLGDEQLRPGRRLRRPGRWPARMFRRHYPTDLATLDDDLFGRFADALPDPRRPRAPDADDWTSLRERLTYIGALMRSRQQAPALAGRLPFSDRHASEIEQGTVPAELQATVVAP